MSKVNLTLPEVLSGNFLLYDLDDKTAVFRPITAEILANSPFLDKRIAIPENHPEIHVPLKVLLDEPDPGRAGPSRYLLHTSHVGSTLIARALGHADQTVSLREPLPIRYLARRRALIEDQRFSQDCGLSLPVFHRLQRHVLALLNRPVEAQDKVLIKCTSWTNQCADTLLAHAKGPARVIALSMGLSAFVANMLKGGGANLDLANGSPERIRRLSRLLPGWQQPLHSLKPGHLVAVAWLVELLSMQRAAQQTSASIMWVNFDDYLQEPAAYTARLASHLDLPWSTANSGRLESSGLFTRYSKSADSRPFDAKNRDNLIADFHVKNPGIALQAQQWLKALQVDHPQALTGLPAWVLAL